jgi:hypothetical protein
VDTDPVTYMWAFAAFFGVGTDIWSYVTKRPTGMTDPGVPLFLLAVVTYPVVAPALGTTRPTIERVLRLITWGALAGYDALQVTRFRRARRAADAADAADGDLT